MKRIAALALCLGLAACTSDQVTTTLEATVDAAIAAATIAAPQDIPYLVVVQSCVDAATSVLESTQTSALKATEIASACATAEAQSANAPIQVKAVAAALQAFLNAVTATATASAIRFERPEAATAFLDAKKPAKLDQRKLRKIREKIATLKAKLKK